MDNMSHRFWSNGCNAERYSSDPTLRSPAQFSSQQDDPIPSTVSPSTGWPCIDNVFLLPDPDPRHTPRRLKYQNWIWTSLWLGSVTFVISSILLPCAEKSSFRAAMYSFLACSLVTPVIDTSHCYLQRIECSCIPHVVCFCDLDFCWQFKECKWLGSKYHSHYIHNRSTPFPEVRLLGRSLITATRLLHLPRQNPSSTLTFILILNLIRCSISSPTFLLLMSISGLPLEHLFSGCYSMAIRRDSEVTLEVGNGI